jgi:hypothetical protein
MSYSINEASAPTKRRGFCIYIDTLCQGVTLAVREDGWPCVFQTEREAQREIVDGWMIRLGQFKDGERAFDDVIVVDEFILPVRVMADGSVIDDEGRQFGWEEF